MNFFHWFISPFICINFLFLYNNTQHPQLKFNLFPKKNILTKDEYQHVSHLDFSYLSQAQEIKRAFQIVLNKECEFLQSKFGFVMLLGYF